MKLQVAEASLPTKYYGRFRIFIFKTPDGKEHAALVLGDVKGKKDVLTRLHSECLTGDVFHSLRCDCGEQLEKALKQIRKHGEGVLLYLRQEGRGIGLFNKIRAYKLQEQGMDTVEANVHLGFGGDMRNYEEAAAILKYLGVRSVVLITNNPQKIQGLRKEGIPAKRLPSKVKSHKLNRGYLATKKKKMGHLI
ncbi:MAG: GTP cyclohydrolase II [Nanoarchaeota archaeon]|nr:GTP cyclohydrolase II [Nanoarchaeota archaeon]